MWGCTKVHKSAMLISTFDDYSSLKVLLEVRIVIL